MLGCVTLACFTQATRRAEGSDANGWRVHSAPRERLLPQLPALIVEGTNMIEAAPFNTADETEFRRHVLLHAPELASHLSPWPMVDWLAAMSIRELAPPAAEPYRGEERRRTGVR
jgi:hypothetical protein